MALLATRWNSIRWMEIALVGVLRGPLVAWAMKRNSSRGARGLASGIRRRYSGRAAKLARLRGAGPCSWQSLWTKMRGVPSDPDQKERAQANVGKLLAWIRQEHRHRPMAAWQEHGRDAGSDARRAGEAESSSHEPVPRHNSHRGHSRTAKGLEFPVVFVSALHRSPERRTPVILFSARSLGPGSEMAQSGYRERRLR